ncbi:glycoside hydrolase family 127 protein [Paenibacillus aurantiacus]|uniref:Glycoside hydrolase family 127 protein n=1 Tax=Paenibacillus aurantiacus TaxID=1936118 RepID=A0ABV5KT10_9BACL
MQNTFTNKNLSYGIVEVQDPFWSPYMQLIRNTVIPYQWEALNDRIPDAEPSYAIHNFLVSAGLKQGEFEGMVFQDSDVTKWLEAVGHSLRNYPDPHLEKIADKAIELIAKAQHSNGYINTYYTIKRPGKQWTNLQEAHELYCAGHLIEAAVAYYEGTGKRQLLDVACKLADHIDDVFGIEEGKIRGYDGHQEIELALVKLYKLTNETRYLMLAKFFIDERGTIPNYLLEESKRRGGNSVWHDQPAPFMTSNQLDYHQAHKPVREQEVAVGHAVRAVYMYTAMADLANLTGDRELREACCRLWENIVNKQMYITGGIGSSPHGEAFTFDYDLPNDTVYSETCASIGLIFFANRMLEMERSSGYADILERALYNNVISSMSQDGMHYFYVNPLEVWPEASEKNPGRRHVKAARQKWFGCSCCPPNVSRLLSSLNDYIYTVYPEENKIYTHLFIGSEAEHKLAAGIVQLKQESRLPWEGYTRFEFTLVPEVDFSLFLRIPSWCSGDPVLKINGVAVGFDIQGGYAVVVRQWAKGDILEWEMNIEAKLVESHPKIRANAGKVAIVRGPLVYCLEETDNCSVISSISINRKSNLEVSVDSTLPGNPIVVKAFGRKDQQLSWREDIPYRAVAQRNDSQSVLVNAVPYYLWGNRGVGEMSVWVRAFDCE